MEKVSHEADEMYNELMADIGHNDINLKDMNDLKDVFRQHINNRRSDDQQELIMNERLIEKLKNMKILSYNILDKFRSLSTTANTNRTDDKETFTDLDDYNKYVTIQQEILRSEIWKVDVFLSFLEDK